MRLSARETDAVCTKMDVPMSTNGKDKTSRAYTYQAAGVDITSGNALVDAIKPLAAATNRPGVAGGIGGFGGLFDLKAAGFTDPILVAATDGVGTKLKIASAIGKHDTIGIDLVAMCVNDLIVQGAEPLFFLDYFATAKLDVEAGAEIVNGIAEGCTQAGCALIGGETAEMPGHYGVGEYERAGFSVGACERGALLPQDNIVAGDKLWGLASSGLHSNGFSLVRHIVKDHGLDYHSPAPYDTSHLLGVDLLTPTRIYVKSLLAALKGPGTLKALAHITGGGLPENLPRILPDHLGAEINLSAITPQPVFGWLKQAGQIETFELLRTFNCGIGMVVIGDDATADILKAQGETICEIGHVIDRTDKQDAVLFTGQLNL